MRIACVESDLGHAQMLQKMLNVLEKHECVMFRRTTELGVALRDQEFDLILLCVHGDGSGGEASVQWLRNTVGGRLPIMVVIPAPDEPLMVRLLFAGADGCLSKPYYPRELGARVMALLRRVNGAGNQKQGPLNVGPYIVDARSQTVTLNGKVIALTSSQFAIALHLFRNTDCLVTRESLERLVWGHPRGAKSRALDTQVSRVRAKLELYPCNGFRLTSVYARGFRLTPIVR